MMNSCKKQVKLSSVNKSIISKTIYIKTDSILESEKVKFFKKF